MARNLQSKLSPSDSVSIFDLNKGAMEKLAQEMRASQVGATVELAAGAAEAARDAVSASNLSYRPNSTSQLYDEFVLSMI